MKKAPYNVYLMASLRKEGREIERGKEGGIERERGREGDRKGRRESYDAGKS